MMSVFRKIIVVMTLLCLFAVMLSGCGGGKGGSTGGNTTAGDGQNSVRYSVRNGAPVSTCVNGGISVDAGIDTNSNGALDPSEVMSTQYVCNGANGTNGSITLVSLVSEPAGTNCTYGGKKVSAGLDSDSNGILDNAEIASSDYICNGADGTDGAGGPSGIDGSDGTNGLNSLSVIETEASGTNCAAGGLKVTSGLDKNADNILEFGEVTTTTYVCNGANGLSTFVSIVTEPAGTNCTNGGQKITSGLDNNSSGSLDSGEIISTKYVCNGENGITGVGITWVDVTTTSIQAVPNTGYMADNDAQVSITLPASLALGDIIQVSGIGMGGWNIVQNSGQSIITKDIAQWIPRSSLGSVSSLASSSDGTKLVAVVNGGQIYTSTNSGVDWTLQKNSPIAFWTSVSSSADGGMLVSVASGTQIYTSTNSGVDWTLQTNSPVANWTSIASSADGNMLVSVASGTQIFTSANSGVDWTLQTNSLALGWSSVASSSDGTKLVAAIKGGQIYTSTNSGVDWKQQSNSPKTNWSSVATSSDGTRLAAVVYGEYIYTSTNSGVNWTQQPKSPVTTWTSVASSSDGTKLVAVVNGGQIYTSTNSGVDWTLHTSSPASSWSSVATSSDGTKLVAAIGGKMLNGSATTYTWATQTTTGISGSISGGQYDAIELQYVGNNTFMILSHEGSLAVQ